MVFDYYYGIEAEQFTFLRIPKVLFTEERFKGLSLEAKVLYGLLLERLSLSMKNGWLDDDNRVFIHYTLENIMEDLGYSSGKCVKIMQELLIGAGFSCGPDGADGDFGPNTARALKRFQSARELAADTVCGKETWEELIYI